MAKIAPFYSTKPNTPDVFHDNSDCLKGVKIEKEFLRQGTDDRRKCTHCARLSA